MTTKIPLKTLYDTKFCRINPKSDRIVGNTPEPNTDENILDPNLAPKTASINPLMGFSDLNYSDRSPFRSVPDE
jgi:hypothetical protein